MLLLFGCGGGGDAGGSVGIKQKKRAGWQGRESTVVVLYQRCHLFFHFPFSVSTTPIDRIRSLEVGVG